MVTTEVYATRVQGLDPTQKLVVDVMAEWADARKKWISTMSTGRFSKKRHTVPPKLNLLLLGTAGTGKTHTAKIGINQVRIAFESYDCVLTLAFSGVAAANLGSGSRTIDSIFHTNQQSADEDLTGADLDNLVEELKHVEL